MSAETDVFLHGHKYCYKLEWTYIMVRSDLHFVPIQVDDIETNYINTSVLTIPGASEGISYWSSEIERRGVCVCVCVCMCVCVEPDLTCNEGILRYVQLFFNQINCMSLI